MKLGKNIFWGVLFLASAVFILLGSAGCFGDISLWTIFFSGLFIAWFIKSVMDLSWGGMLFSLAFEAILFDEALGITHMTPFPVLLAALFGTIGLNMIFKKKNVSGNMNGGTANGDTTGTSKSMVDVELEEDELFKCEVNFGSSVKYVNSKFLKLAHIENSFGSLMVYFDNAELGAERVEAEISNAFGKLSLFVPREWDTRVELTKSFGNVSEIGRPTGESGKLFVIKGDASFGQVEITYI